MRSRDLDEPDLYPPDLDDHDLTPELKSHRLRVAIGGTLLVWGMSLLVQRSFGVDIDTFVLGLGVGALAGWTQVRRYLWFAFGAIATGFGLSEVAGALIPGAFGAGVGSLLAAGGFLAVYVRYPRRSMWALFPAGFMALIGVGAFGVGLLGLIPEVFGRFLLPLLLVTGGGLLLFRHSLPPRTVKIGLAAIVALFVLVGVNRVPDIDHHPGPQFSFGPNGAVLGDGPQILPVGAGQTLVLHGAGDGDITLQPSRDGAAHLVAAGRGRPRFFDTRTGPGNQVIVETRGRGMFGADDGDVNYVLSLPPGVDVDIERGNGRVSGTLVGASATIQTEDGDVNLRLEGDGSEDYVSDGAVRVTTDGGNVHVESKDVPLKLLAVSHGDVEVNDQDYEDLYQSPKDAAGVEVNLVSADGDLVVEMPKPVTGSSESSPSTTTTVAAPTPTTSAPSN